jgi:hypothetical protein
LLVQVLSAGALGSWALWWAVGILTW